ncbi:hypothetical protein [Nonomuraea longicatena]|uniref:Uncharacterized protein n=1 Tax=Nonomuraea longicatena TaxID=83682 RepID=A0ABP4BUB7_9ACTN
MDTACHGSGGRGMAAKAWVVEGLESYGNAPVLRDHPLFARTAVWTFPTRRLSLYERAR